MKKLLSMLVLTVMFSFPVVRDGGKVVNLENVLCARQINNWVLFTGSGDASTQINFYTSEEASHFLDMYFNWLAEKGRK